MNMKRNVYLMYAIIFLQGFVFYGPVATLYRQARGLSMTDIFVIESISWILMILFEIPWGWFADRFGYKKTIVISNIIFFISKVIFYRAFSFNMFLLERTFLALALAGLSGCDIALLYASTEGKHSQKVFGRYSAFSTSGLLIASLLSTFVIGSSLDKAGLLTIYPYALAAILGLFIKDLKICREEKPKITKSLRRALRNVPIIMLVLSFALAREVVQSITVFLNQGQYLRSGINIKYFGILVAVVQLARLSSAKAYVFSDRFGKEKSIKSLYICITLCCLLMIIFSNALVSIFSIMLIAASMSLVEPMVMDIQNKVITSGDRATMLSIYAMIGDVSAAVVNPVIGWAADISLGAAFIVCLTISVIALILFTIYRRKEIRVSQ